MMDTIDAKSFEAANKKIQLIQTVGDGPWQIEVYYNSDDGYHYAKGPFARWDAICYVKLPFTDKEKIDDWIKKMTEAK